MVCGQRQASEEFSHNSGNVRDYWPSSEAGNREGRILFHNINRKQILPILCLQKPSIQNHNKLCLTSQFLPDTSNLSQHAALAYLNNFYLPNLTNVIIKLTGTKD